jgi:F420-dependent oxidoreductase-like protein
MPEIGIMVEGQNGMNWPRWQRIARTVEDAGFVGLFRSDHYTNPDPPDLDSLELWVSLTWLASYTKRIVFGPVVSPVSFRHPTMTARMAAAVDDLSGGRLILGLGAGWQEREHTNYGLELLGSLAERFDRFDEALKVIRALLKRDDPSHFDGKYYHLNDAVLLPRPQRPGGPPIMIGGRGPKRTLPLVARYADEWNAVFIDPEKIPALNLRLDELLIENDRQPSDVLRSLMTGCVFGRDDTELARKRANSGYPEEDFSEKRLVVGTPNAIVDQVARLDDIGISRVMLQWLDLDDIDGLEAMAALVLPQLA